MKELLQHKKLNVTPFRLEVLEVFAKYNTAIPLSVIEKELSNFNRITLYRTIKKFIASGVIHEIALSGEDNNFAICADNCGVHDHQHQHIHFKCEKCKSVQCVEIDTFPAIQIPNYTINNVEIQATGYCSQCQ